MLTAFHATEEIKGRSEETRRKVEFRQMNPGQTYAVSRVVNQTLDQLGNLTQTQVYDYSGVRRTYNNTYVNWAPYRISPSATS